MSEILGEEKRRKRERDHLGSGARVVNSGGDEDATLAVEDERPLIVAHIERLEVFLRLRHR